MPEAHRPHVAKRIRVAVADDHAILRSGLRMLIQSQADLEVAGEAADGQQAIDLVRQRRPDVLLLDLTMPNVGGMQAISKLLAVDSALRILVLTMHDDVAYAKSVLAAGARGFVLKRSVDAELLAAIRAVYRGGTFVDPSLAEAVMAGALGRRKFTHPVLSERELEVLRAVAEGFSPREIAQQLHVSVKTVETYRTRIAEKLDLRTRHDIVRYCLETGILKSDQTAKPAP